MFRTLFHHASPFPVAGLLALSAAMACAPLARASASPASASDMQAPPVAAALDPAASERLARGLRDAHDPMAAVAIYRRLIARQNSDPTLQVDLGEALLEADHLDEAIAAFDAAPDSARAQLGLARVQLRMDRPEAALTLVERAAALIPRNERILITRGVVLDRLGRHAEAQASYRAALAVSPHSAAARSDLALSLAMTGQCDAAIDILAPIGRSADATPQDRQNLAFVYGLKGDRIAALALGEADLDPKTAEANQAFYDYARTHAN